VPVVFGGASWIIFLVAVRLRELALGLRSVVR